MSLSAGSIMATLGLDVSGFTRGMMTANAMAAVFPSVVTNFMANPLLGLIDVAQRAGRALVSLFTDSLGEADKIHDMAINVGVTTEFLSGMGLVAQQAGSGVQSVADALKFLGKNAAEAVGGNKDLAGEFRRLGIAVTDGSGAIRPASELLLEFADAMAALPEGGARTNAAMTLLGRSGTELIATLAGGSAAIREQMRTFDQYGATISGKAAESADVWGDAMGEMQIAWRGFKNMIAEPLRDALLPYLNSLLEWVRTHPEEIRAKAAQIAETIAGAALTASAAIETVMDNLRATLVLMGTFKGVMAGSQIGSLVGGPVGGIVGGIAGGIIGGGGTYMATAAPAPAGNTYNANVTVQQQGQFDVRQMSDAVMVKWQRENAARAATERLGL